MMKEKEFKSNPCQSELASPAAPEHYTAPDIEVIDIEIENCFAASPGGETEDIPAGGIW